MKIRCAVLSSLVACTGAEVTGLQGDAGSTLDASWSLPELRPSVGTPPVLASIGPEGGAFTSSDGRFEVIAPAGTFDQVQTLSIEEVSTTTGVARVYRVGPDLPLLGPVLLKYRPREQEWPPSPIAARLQTRTGTTWSELPWVGHIERAAIVAASNALGDFAFSSASCTGLDQGEANHRSRVDHCVLDLDTQNGDFYGIPCSSDLQCPSPSYCQNGGCFLRPCRGDDLCVRDEERCFGAPRAGVCLPECDGHACLFPSCGSDNDCPAGEICSLASERARSAGGRCVPPNAGCSSRYQSCPVRVRTVGDGFSLERNDEPGALWVYGARPERDLVSLLPFDRLPERHGASVWWWGAADGYPSVGRTLGSADEFLDPTIYRADGSVVLRSSAWYGTIQHPVVRFFAPYAGHYAISGRFALAVPNASTDRRRFTARLSIPDQGLARDLTTQAVGLTLERPFVVSTRNDYPEGIPAGTALDFWVILADRDHFTAPAHLSATITYLGP